MLSSEQEAAHAPKQKINVDYEIGDAVKVLDGPFASFNGVVEELADVVQRQRVERLELPDAAEVEEDVAGEGPLHEPDPDAEPDTCEGDEAPPEARASTT